MSHMMQAQVIASLAITVNKGRNFDASALERGADGLIGFACVDGDGGLISREAAATHSRLSFFQIDLVHGVVSRQARPCHVMTAEPHLHYDRQWQTWILSLSDSHAQVRLYALRLGQEDWLQEFAHINTDELNATFFARNIVMEKQDQEYHYLYYSGSLDMVSDNVVYWASWKQEDPALIIIPHQAGVLTQVADCDRAIGCVLSKANGEGRRYLLLLCVRDYDQEPAYYTPRKGAGSWRLCLHVYDTDARLITRRFLTDRSFRIRDTDDPGRDLYHGLNIRMTAIEGPRSAGGQQQMCVAALVLDTLVTPAGDEEGTDRSIPADEEPRSEGGQQQKSLTELILEALAAKAREEDGTDLTPPAEQGQGERQQLGGLFCLDAEGNCLQESREALGIYISLCRCGKQIIGTDVLQGRGRLWTWSPLEAGALRVCQQLEEQMRRATVVRHEQDEQRFWLVEEYKRRVKVSLYRCGEQQECTELATTWLEEVTLPARPMSSDMVQQLRPAGVLAYQDSVLILGVDQHQQLTLFQVQV